MSLVAGAPGGTVFGIDVTDPLVVTRADTAPSVPLAELDVEPLQGLELPSGDELALEVMLAADPAWPDQQAEAAVVVRDGLGLVHRFDDRQVVPGDTTLTWPVADVVGPVHLLALDVTTQAGDISGRGYEGPARAEGAPLPPPELRLTVGPPTVDGQAAPPAGGHRSLRQWRGLPTRARADPVGPGGVAHRGHHRRGRATRADRAAPGGAPGRRHGRGGPGPGGGAPRRARCHRP